MRKELDRTDAEIQAILTNTELDENARTQAIKDLVGKSFVPTTKYNEVQAKIEAEQKEKNTILSEYETFKQSKMTEEEKQSEKSKAEQEENRKIRKRLNEMTAKEIFIDAGFKKEDYGDILPSIVKENEEETKSLATLFCNSLLKQKETIEKNITDKIVNGAKTPPAGNDDAGDNKSDLDKYKQGLKDAKEKNDFAKEAYYTRLIQMEESKEE